MSKRIVIVLFSFLILLVLFALRDDSLKNYRKVKAQIGGKSYTLFVADDEEKMQRGLSAVKELKNDEGMIFIFNKPDYHRFWMKEMQFPLDFIFLQDNKIVDILTNIKPETYPQTFKPKIPADKVVEVNSREVEKMRLKIGDNIRLFR